MFAILAISLLLFLAMAVAAVVAAKTVGQVVGRQAFPRPPGDSDVNVRLTRIEEAIDAMAAREPLPPRANPARPPHVTPFSRSARDEP